MFFGKFVIVFVVYYCVSVVRCSGVVWLWCLLCDVWDCACVVLFPCVVVSCLLCYVLCGVCMCCDLSCCYAVLGLV